MTSMAVNLTEADLGDTLTQIWLAYLNPNTTPVPAWDAVDEETWAEQVRVHAAADIRGGWEGTIIVEMSTRLALDIATTLYSQPLAVADLAEDVWAQELPRAERSLVFDAIGEVVNIVAGNLKALLPQPSTLSLPRVAFLPARAPDSPAADAATPADGWTVDFMCGEHLLRLTIQPRDSHR